MTIDKIIVIISSSISIAFTYWFFLMKKEQEVAVTSDSVDIIVSGGYQPEVISIPNRKTTTIHFTRRDPSRCLEEVVLSDFNIRRFLPLHQKVSIKVTPHKEGVYSISCGMNMFHGKVKVV